MTDEKKEFCLPRLKEDFIIFLLAICGGIVLLLVCFGAGKIYPISECYGDVCGPFETTFEGLIRIVIIFFLTYVVCWPLYERYWMTEKECYEEDI